MTKSKGRILVIRGGAIGDFILTLPVFAALRRQFPDSHLEVLGYPHIASLAQAGGLVDAVRTIEDRGFAMFFAPGVPPQPDLAAFFSSFDIILSYLYDPDRIFETNVTACSTGQFIAGPHRPSEALTTHATEVFLKPLERLAIFDADTGPQLRLKSSPHGSQSPPAIALHPGSGSERKNWPEQNWRWLIEQILTQTDWNVLVIGGEAEGDRLGRLTPQSNSRLGTLQSRPLIEVAGALQNAAAFIGHDSGITHLAAALGLPGIVLWGVSNEAIWCPRSEHFRVLRSPAGIGSITVDKVFAELRLLVPG